MIEHLTVETFKDKVFDYETNKEWKFEGNRPCLIDFYTEWCSPCKTLTPILEELSKEYKNKVDIYKVNIEDEYKLSSIFGIQSVPSLLFVSLEGMPKMTVGALPKDKLKSAIKELL